MTEYRVLKENEINRSLFACFIRRQIVDQCVRRDNGNSLNTFSGIFLHVQPGQNTFKYTGAACKIDIQYTGRWFV